jgi:hypothetical protein
VDRHHIAAVVTVSVAALGDVILGTAFGYADHIGVPAGLFFAVTTATTVGYGDITPHGWLPHLLAVTMMVTIIPLFGATFSLFTSGLASARISQLGSGLHTRLQRIEENHRRVCAHLGLPPAPAEPGLPEVPGD